MKVTTTRTPAVAHYYATHPFGAEVIDRRALRRNWGKRRWQPWQIDLLRDATALLENAAWLFEV